MEEVSKRAFSIGEIATKSDVSPAFIYQQIAERKLRARKIGRRTVVLDEDRVPGGGVRAPIMA